MDFDLATGIIAYCTRCEYCHHPTNCHLTTLNVDSGIAYGEILDLDGYDAFGNAVNTVRDHILP